MAGMISFKDRSQDAETTIEDCQFDVTKNESFVCISNIRTLGAHTFSAYYTGDVSYAESTSNLQNINAERINSDVECVGQVVLDNELHIFRRRP